MKMRNILRIRRFAIAGAVAAVILSAVSCFDMYGELLDGTKIRAGILLANNTGIEVYEINGKGYPQSRNDLFPSYADVFVKALSLDYDHDEDCDIALLASNGYIRILLNNGKGHFNQLLYEYTGVTTPTDMASADFNRDGKPDFVLGTTAVSGIHLYTSPSVTSSTGPGITVKSVTTGDIDGDGATDIYAGMNATASNYYFINTSVSSISFTTLSMPVISNPTNDTLLINIDNDNDNDLIFTNGTYIYIYLNNGAGNFSSSSSHSSVSFSKIAAGDVNNDGYQDLFAGQTNPAAGSDLFINNRAGAFTNTHLATDMNEAKLFDIDFDGDLDIIGKSNSQLVIMKNDGSGNFSLHASTAVSLPNSITVFTYEED